MSGRTAVLLATSPDLPALDDDDRPLVEALGALGIGAAPLVWSDPAALDLPPGEVVVVRSCWDYHLHPARFLGWIDALEGRGVELVNPAPLLRWNLHKRYLVELGERGIPVVPTELVESGRGPTLAEVLARRGWERAVVKPAVSLSAHETWRLSRAEAAGQEARFAALRARGDVLVQRFVPEIVSEGEWSLVFLGGEYSHAVRKRPKAGDFRVQSDHGGRATPEAPPAWVLEGARRVLDSLAETPVYARVDGVAAGGRLLLMELECIDPSLFLGAHPPAAERLARLLTSRLAAGLHSGD